MFLYSPIYYSYISYIHSFTQQQRIITNQSILTYIITISHPFANFIIIFHLSISPFLALHILTLSIPFIFYSTALPFIYLITHLHQHTTQATWSTPILLIFNYTYFLHTLYIIPFILAKNIKIDNTFDHVQFSDLSKYTLQSNQQLLFPYIPIYYSYISYLHSFTQQQGIITNSLLLTYMAIFRLSFTDFILILSITTLTLKNKYNNHQYSYSIHFIYTLYISFNHQILH